uniref:HEAT repeat domain-containing protein n=1 Tax=Hassallia byssoidea TaxID=482630 RepID=UPI0019147700|nr:HEAT repeat domain-containing protein [Hassalia byssoidea]
MEENFNNIEWNRIDAPDIDKNMLGVIQSLASYDFEARKEALTDLFDMIWHQGTLSWSASFAVPFLIERLQQEPEAELLENILLDLVHLGTGSSFCDAHQNLSIYEDKRNTLEFQQQMQEELEGVRATYQAVYKGVNIYFDLLEHESPQVRIAAAYTLSCCKSEAARICTKLYARFSCEPDELVKATISLCLAFLSKSTPVQIAFFEQVLKSNESDIVKLSAAITLAYIASEHMYA